MRHQGVHGGTPAADFLPTRAEQRTIARSAADARSLAAAIGNRAMVQVARDARSGPVIARAWLDDQVDAVSGPLQQGQEQDALNQLNGYSTEDQRRIIGRLTIAQRARLKAILGDFIGVVDVERIRMSIAMVEGGGTEEVVHATEHAHDLIRGDDWNEAFEYLFTGCRTTLRKAVLYRLSTGHLKALIEHAVDGPTDRPEWVSALVEEVGRREGVRVSDGRDFKPTKRKDDTGGNAAVDASEKSPSGNVAAMMIDGADDASYRLELNTWREDGGDFVGHAWIAVNELAFPFRRFSFGFWPGENAKKPKLAAGVRGSLRSPDGHDGQQLFTDTAFGDRKQIAALRDVVAAYAGRQWELFGDNCAQFAQDAWKAMTGNDTRGSDWFTTPRDIEDKR